MQTLSNKIKQKQNKQAIAQEDKKENSIWCSCVAWNEVLCAHTKSDMSTKLNFLLLLFGLEWLNIAWLFKLKKQVLTVRPGFIYCLVKILKAFKAFFMYLFINTTVSKGFLVLKFQKPLNMLDLSFVCTTVHFKWFLLELSVLQQITLAQWVWSSKHCVGTL